MFQSNFRLGELKRRTSTLDNPKDVKRSLAFYLVFCATTRGRLLLIVDGQGKHGAVVQRLVCRPLYAQGETLMRTLDQWNHWTKGFISLYTHIRHTHEHLEVPIG